MADTPPVKVRIFANPLRPNAVDQEEKAAVSGGGFYDIGIPYDSNDATPRTLTDNDLKGIVASAGWISGKPFSCAQRVVIAESSKRTDATSRNPDGGTNIGIFQIDSKNVRYPNRLKSPKYNARVARRMWLADGMTFSKHWQTAAPGGTLPPEPGLEDDATNPVDDASRTISGAVDNVGDFLTLLSKGSTWERVGLVVLGGVLTTAAVLILAGEFMKSVPTPVSSAIKAVKS